MVSKMRIPAQIIYNGKTRVKVIRVNSDTDTSSFKCDNDKI